MSQFPVGLSHPLCVIVPGSSGSAPAEMEVTYGAPTGSHPATLRIAVASKGDMISTFWSVLGDVGIDNLVEFLSSGEGVFRVGAPREEDRRPLLAVHEEDCNALLLSTSDGKHVASCNRHRFSKAIRAAIVLGC